MLSKKPKHISYMDQPCGTWSMCAMRSCDFMAKSYNRVPTANIVHGPTVRESVGVCDMHLVIFSGQELQKQISHTTNRSESVDVSHVGNNISEK